MADFTTLYAQLMDWSTLDDTGGIPTLETAELALDTYIKALIHIDVSHQDGNDAGTNNAVVVVWIKAGTTDEDWHELVRFEATGGTASTASVDSNCGAAIATPSWIYVAVTTAFETPGDKYFLKDVGTLINSCIVANKDFNNDDYVECIDNIVNAYDNADLVFFPVDQWNVDIPMPCKALKVTFHNPDADATYACRVQYSVATDIE